MTPYDYFLIAIAAFNVAAFIGAGLLVGAYVASVWLNWPR